MSMVDGVRERVGAAIFAKVAGEEGAGRRERIHGTTGPRRFGPEDAIWQVHSDAAMFVGGVRALLLQSLHPLAMAAVDQHSGYRGDPWGRLARTSGFLAETTFGTTEHADRAIAVVRSVHDRIDGVAPDGRPYRAADPRLLRWVHVAEVDSFLRAHDAYGARPLDAEARDDYVAQTAVIARALGATQVPTTVAELHETIEEFRPELASTEAARRTARFILLRPPVPLAVRPAYGLLCSAGVGLLPRWARWPLRLPYVPVAEATAVRASGIAITSGIRWAMGPGPRAVQEEPRPA
ncbi:DUF2236 domain-containing protein [Nocardioides panacisoli]|uniref:oxygenase MpaB family protein n=1 Tax=Nocardioides panacisoli TaxID=627624 RepID=UPI001C639EF9|nr:oxygenase MpaB family protein [Nocardioides panacisoli]QYJ04683.1 DUF2236 domain-containing protein [Nocardioides panacisoli]